MLLRSLRSTLFPYTTLFRSSEETLERLMGDPADADLADARSRLEQLIQDIIDRMMQEGFITGAPDLEPERSEEHTSELQSHSDLVCRLLLEKKKGNFEQDDR